MRFRTKVDWWIGLMILVIPVIAVVTVSQAAVQDGEWWLLPVVLGVFVLVSFILWPCEYVLHEKELQVRSGIVSWRIPYESIDRVNPTRNPLSSPAWSLDRLAIYYGRNQVMVSPADKVEFLSHFMRRTGLRQRGEELVRDRG